MYVQLFGSHLVQLRVLRSDHGEQGAVNAIGTSGENLQLTTFFATVHQELAGVLEVVAGNGLAQNALWRNGGTRCRHQQTNLPLGNNGHGRFMHGELPGKVKKVPTRGQCIGLVTGFSFQGNKLPGVQTRAKLFDDDANFFFADDHQTQNGFDEDSHHQQTKEAYQQNNDSSG